MYRHECMNHNEPRLYSNGEIVLIPNKWLTFYNFCRPWKLSQGQVTQAWLTCSNPPPPPPSPPPPPHHDLLGQWELICV